MRRSLKLLTSETCSPAGTGAAEENRVFRNTWFLQISTVPLISCCLYLQIAYFKSGSYLASTQAGEGIVFLFYCAKAPLWLKIITRLRWEEQPSCAAMLIRTCSHGDARDTHSTWLKAGWAVVVTLMNISKLVLCHKSRRRGGDTLTGYSFQKCIAAGFVPVTEGDSQEMRSFPANQSVTTTISLNQC